MTTEHDYRAIARLVHECTGLRVIGPCCLCRSWDSIGDGQCHNPEARRQTVGEGGSLQPDDLHYGCILWDLDPSKLPPGR